MSGCGPEALRDSLGRRRRPTQSKGLRPLYPPLETGQRSASVRIAMSERAWAVLERAVEASTAPTRPRAVGEIVERSLGTHAVVDWQDWQIRKEKQLLEEAAREAVAS